MLLSLVAVIERVKHYTSSRFADSQHDIIASFLLSYMVEINRSRSYLHAKRVTKVAFPSVSSYAEHSSEPVNRRNPSIQFSLPLNQQPAATDGLSKIGNCSKDGRVSSVFRSLSGRLYELNMLLSAAAQEISRFFRRHSLLASDTKHRQLRRSTTS